MSMLQDAYEQPSLSAALIDAQFDFSGMGGMFNFDALQDTADDGGGGGMAGQGGGMTVEQGFDGEEEDQNAWMKVFVPSLLLAGFPRQLPSATIQSPTSGPSSASNNIHIQPFPAPIPPFPTLDINAESTVPFYPTGPDASLDPAFLDPSTSFAFNYGTNYTSPPASLSTLRYPFQSLDTYAPPFASTQFAQPPPISPSSAMMQYLSFPETPGAPKTAQMGGSMMSAGAGPGGDAFAGMGAGLGTVGTPATPATDAWDIFRAPAVPIGTYQPGNKRKRGQRPMPTTTITAASSGSTATSSDPPVLDVARDEQIKTQVALEAELKLAVDELNGRVRGIISRTTPDVARDAGVSDMLGETEDDWGAAKAIISKVTQSPLQTLSDSPAEPLIELPSASATTSSSVAAYKGPWREEEVARLRQIVLGSREMLDRVSVVNWGWVAESFGPTRSKHQILCKAVELGLKGTSTTAGRRKRQKKNQSSGSSSLGRSVSTSGEDGEAEDDVHSCTTATSFTPSL